MSATAGGLRFYLFGKWIWMHRGKSITKKYIPTLAEETSTFRARSSMLTIACRRPIHIYVHTYRIHTGGTCWSDSITLAHLSWGLDIECGRVVLACDCHTIKHDTGGDSRCVSVKVDSRSRYDGIVLFAIVPR